MLLLVTSIIMAIISLKGCRLLLMTWNLKMYSAYMVRGTVPGCHRHHCKSGVLSSICKYHSFVQLEVAPGFHTGFLPAGRAQRLVLRLLCCFRVCIYVRLHLSHAQIITSRTLLPCNLDFSNLDGCFAYVAAMSSLPQLRLRDGYREAEAT